MRGAAIVGLLRRSLAGLGSRGNLFEAYPGLTPGATGSLRSPFRPLRGLSRWLRKVPGLMQAARATNKEFESACRPRPRLPGLAWRLHKAGHHASSFRRMSSAKADSLLVPTRNPALTCGDTLCRRCAALMETACIYVWIGKRDPASSGGRLCGGGGCGHCVRSRHGPVDDVCRAAISRLDDRLLGVHGCGSNRNHWRSRNRAICCPEDSQSDVKQKALAEARVLLN
jgi:hypothetical protein